MEEEEIKRREEARLLKKQKEKEKIEQLKKEGRFLTKAQKEEKARNERKLQQMLAAGIKVGPQESADEPKKKVAKDIKKKKGRSEKVSLHPGSKQKPTHAMSSDLFILTSAYK